MSTSVAVIGHMNKFLLFSLSPLSLLDPYCNGLVLCSALLAGGLVETLGLGQRALFNPKYVRVRNEMPPI